MHACVHVCVRMCVCFQKCVRAIKRTTATFAHLVVQILNPKSLTEVSEDLWAVLLELEMTREILPVARIIINTSPYQAAIV